MNRLLLLVFALLVSCSKTSISAPRPAPLLSTASATFAEPTLLASYAVTVPAGAYSQPRTQGFLYQPGTGVLTIPANISGASFAYQDWLTLTLNRPALLTIPGTRLSWMTDWTQVPGGYSKTFPAGVVVLGPPSGSVYPSVTITEANGQPSPVPTTSAGQPVPAPNQPCPAWVHDQYTATGPDGISYPTWHPQIDPVYWCYFGHEHGSKPADGASPLYGYTAAKNGMPEPHAGFKTYTVADGLARWTITQHFGTGGVGRACTRFHTLDVSYTVSGSLKADLHFMGDFGKGKFVLGSTATPITGCTVNQATLPTNGARNINLAGNQGYEPWRTDLSRVVLGFTSPALTFDTGDPQTSCADGACLSVVRGAGSGTDHRVSLGRPLRIQATAGASGVFFTDPMGRRFVSEADSGATRQYVEPGLNVSSPPVVTTNTTCSTPDAWVGLMTCGGRILSPDKNLENGIQNGN